MVRCAEYEEKFHEALFKGIAHRGLHDESRTENGLAAFENAIMHGLAFEFDIHLTKDKRLVVCHDENLKRTTGRDGLIRDLTLEEIKKNYKLHDGGAVPTLEEVLELNNEAVPMVIELKAENRNHKELCYYANEALKNIKNTKKVTIISFDPRALIGVKRFTRGLLVCFEKKWTLMFRRHFDYLDVEWTLLDNKKVKRWRKRKYVNAWTIDSIQKMNKCRESVDMVTFQFIKPEEAALR